MRKPRYVILFLLAFAVGLNSPLAGQNPADDDVAVRVQITEMGLLRTLLVLNDDALDLEERLAQHLTEYDFRVFPSAETVTGRAVPSELSAAGERAGADLIVYARVSSRLRNRMQDFALYEGEAAVQIYSRVSGELLVTQQERVTGTRSSDDFEARRNARERALDGAAAAAVRRSLDRAHKILVHQAVLVNVFSESALLALMEHIATMDGVYHVRRLSFDRTTNEALVEIIGAPHSETFWRAHLEGMPRTRVNVQLTPHDELRNKYPSWFLPPSL